jgi:hypothetical protein
MKPLRHKDQGPFVRKWQTFLLGQDLYFGKIDGDFGPKTLEATKLFQQRAGLNADGVVGNQTLGEALRLGFTLFEDPGDERLGPNWPGLPTFFPLVSTSERQTVFGKFRFKHVPLADNPENIQILDNWEAQNIQLIEIPQIASINNGSPRVRFHKKGINQLKRLWQDWEDANLLPAVKTWHGAFVPRFVRGSRTQLSNHAFGTAFDINMRWNRLGATPALVGKEGCVRELVEIAHQNGFYWGGHFQKRADGMHFELASVME